MIKLTKLHKVKHPQGCYNNYRHDSSKSLYGYKNFRIRTDDHYGGWYVEEIRGGIRNQISDYRLCMTFKEAKKWLEEYLDKERTKTKLIKPVIRR